MRNDRQYRRNREALKRAVLSFDLPCAICHGALGPINVLADRNDPLAFEADHTTPVSVAMRAGMSSARAQRGDLRPAHRICNQRRGNREDPNPNRLATSIEVEF